MISLKDISREVGISVSVVSRVLNPKPDLSARVSDKTKEKVLATAKKLGYQRSRTGEFLRKGKSAVLGIFIPDYSNNLITDLILGISEAANNLGFPISIYPGCSPKDYLNFINLNLKTSACGIITYSSPNYHLPKEEPILDKYLQQGGKILVLNDTSEIRFPTLSMDEITGGKLAAKMLINNSVEKLVFIKTSENNTGALGNLRLKGFIEEAKHNNVDLESKSMAFLWSLIRKKNGNIGVFCTSDVEAIKLMNEGRRKGFIPGKDYYLVGYDNINAGSLVSPPLSTIEQPFRQEGIRAVEKLYNMIYGKSECNELITPIPIRRSTC